MEIVLLMIIQLAGAPANTPPIQREGKMDTVQECAEAVTHILEHPPALPDGSVLAVGCRITYKGKGV